MLSIVLVPNHSAAVLATATGSCPQCMDFYLQNSGVSLNFLWNIGFTVCIFYCNSENGRPAKQVIQKQDRHLVLKVFGHLALKKQRVGV
jgi:hypothetical protein